VTASSRTTGSRRRCCTTTRTASSVEAVEAGVRVVPRARYAAADGLSHLGLVAGVGAPTTSWSLMDEFLAGR
jgi:hypothetical protein